MSRLLTFVGIMFSSTRFEVSPDTEIPSVETSDNAVRCYHREADIQAFRLCFSLQAIISIIATVSLLLSHLSK